MTTETATIQQRNAELTEKNAQLNEHLEEAKAILLKQEHELAGVYSQPMVYGSVLSVDHEIDPSMYEVEDRVIVVDEELPDFCGRVGKIVEVDLEGGTVKVEFYGKRNKPKFYIGLSNVINPKTTKPYTKQIQLLGKNDGTNIVVHLGDKVLEMWNFKGFNPNPGDTAKCNLKTCNVIEISLPQPTGDSVNVLETARAANELEVEIGGQKRWVQCRLPEVEVGDKVVLDPSGTVAVRHISNESTKRYKLREESLISWKDIGGAEEAKSEIQEALLAQHVNPEFHKFYNLPTPAGFLLYGPPGCGKTLLGRATAHQLAAIHGKTAVQSGFNYIKGPEILSMWVGESEAQTRAVFARMRRHYELHGYPALTFVDEADAIFTERGSHQSQHWHDTLVAQWLSEMDGFDRRAGILMFATNRAKALDGAVVREGRIDKHIKVHRPDRESGRDVFLIHLHGTPLADSDPDTVAKVGMEEFLDNPRPLYRIHCTTTKKEGEFCLGDCVSGSMIKAVIDQAKSYAYRRAVAAGKKGKGVKLNDFRDAIATIYLRHRGTNHNFDLLDYAERLGMNDQTLKIERVSTL